MDHPIRVAEPQIGVEELQNVTTAVKSGWISSRGPFIGQFEKEFSAYVGTKHGVAVCNGTAALHLALQALGIGRGDEVIVPSLTFVAVANAVAYTGAMPVFVDSHPDYWCMDPESLRASITGKTKAIIPVHLYGHPCDMDAILTIARSHNIFVIEDCAEAHGAEYKGRKVGSFGDTSCFSFYGNKTITTGEGGMCLTNDDKIELRMRVLRDHGMNPSKRYWHDVLGFNYRMTNLQAALGVAQLKKIEQLVDRKRKIASKYKELLRVTPGIVQPPEMPWARSTFWFYSLLVDSSLRDKIITALDEQNIETRPFFFPVHTLPPHHRDKRLPVAEELSSRGLNLPSGPSISDDEIAHVAWAFSRLMRSLGR